MTDVSNDKYSIVNGGVKVPYSGWYIVSASAYVAFAMANQLSHIGVYVRKQTNSSASYTETGVSQRFSIYSSSEGAITSGIGLVYLQDGEIVSMSVRLVPSTTPAYTRNQVSQGSSSTFLTIIYTGKS